MTDAHAAQQRSFRRLLEEAVELLILACDEGDFEPDTDSEPTSRPNTLNPDSKFAPLVGDRKWTSIERRTGNG